MENKIIVALQLGEKIFSAIRINEVNFATTGLNISAADDDIEEDEELCTLATFSYSKEKPRRVEMFVGRVINNYTKEEFQRNFRMSTEAFDFLMEKITPILTEFVSVQHMKIPLEKQVLSVIWLLANQECFRSVGERFDMTKSTLSKVFFRVIECLNKMASEAIRWPTREEMQESSIHFEEKSKLKKIIGAIDGTYVPVKAPGEQKEAYTNRKMFTAVTLQAICNHKMEFIDCFAGFPSSAHDGRVFRNSAIYNDIVENPISFFPRGERILGDKAYPLTDWCLVAYTDRGTLSAMQKHFNYVHASARQITERSFALLFGRFRRLKYIDMNCFEFVPQTIIAACVLHNFCIKFPDGSIDLFVEEGMAEIHGSETDGMEDTLSRRIGRNFIEQRDRIARDLWNSRRRQM